MSKGKKQGLVLLVAIGLILVGIFQSDFGKWGNDFLSKIFPAQIDDINSSATPSETGTPNSTGTPGPNQDGTLAPNTSGVAGTTKSAETEEPDPTDIPVGAQPIRTDASGKVEYFSKERIERDASRARIKEEYVKITDDDNASQDIKTNAYNSIMELTRLGEAEKKIEMMVEEKGYDDCFACYSDAGDIDIIIKAEKLTTEDVVQISDIVARHGNVTMDKIHIRSEG